MKGARWPWWVMAAWVGSLCILLAGLLAAPAGIAGAPSTDYLAFPRLLRLSMNSLLTAAGAALLALALTLLPALALARFLNRRWTRWLLPVAVAPLFVSPEVIAVAGVHLLGPQGWMTRLVAHGVFALTGLQMWDPREPQALPSPIYTMTGVTLCLAWCFLPTAFLTSWAALRSINRSLEETALLESGPLQVLRRITLPLAAPAIMAGVVLVFLMSMLEFGVPESLRNQPVLVTEIYTQLGIHYDAQSAFVVAGLLAVIALLVTRVALGFMRRAFFTDRLMDAPEAHDDERPLMRGTAVKLLAATGVVLLLIPSALLLITLMLRLNGPDGMWGTLVKTWGLTRDEFYFTLEIASQGALAATAAGVFIGAALAKLRNPFSMRALVLVGFFIPGSVVAVALKMLLLWPPQQLPALLDRAMVALDASYVPLIFAYVIRFAPLVALLAEFHLRQVPQDLIDATRLESGGPIAALKGWAGQALLAAAAPGLLITLALITGESGATVLLIPPGKTMLSVRLLTLMHFAPTAQVSALCLLMCIPSLVALPVITLVWEKISSRANLRLSRSAASRS
ncbi:iron ABC transporter permease [Candidatus Sumerlaeota bacterium]|nr:iron ABC transporter permease [Candidatus Sumerlaeota bacterium]